MDYKFKTSQENLRQIYEAAITRINAHLDYSEGKREIVKKSPVFDNERKAIEFTIKLMQNEASNCLIWAEIGKDEEYYILKSWIVTNSGNVFKAAEYLGLVMIYDSSILTEIINGNISIDDVLKHE